MPLTMSISDRDHLADAIQFGSSVASKEADFPYCTLQQPVIEAAASLLDTCKDKVRGHTECKRILAAVLSLSTSVPVDYARQPMPALPLLRAVGLAHSSISSRQG